MAWVWHFTLDNLFCNLKKTTKKHLIKCHGFYIIYSISRVVSQSRKSVETININPYEVTLGVIVRHDAWIGRYYILVHYYSMYTIYRIRILLRLGKRYFVKYYKILSKNPYCKWDWRTLPTVSSCINTVRITYHVKIENTQIDTNVWMNRHVW